MANYLILFLFCGVTYAINVQGIIEERYQALMQMKNLNPATILPQYTNNPSEATLRPDEKSNGLLNAANQAIKLNQEANQVYRNAQNSHTVPANPVQPGVDKIVESENPSSDLSIYDNTLSEPTIDLNEALVQLGALSGAASEVASKQIGSRNPAIFRGTNLQCRIAVAGIGNCCGGHARFLHCSEQEKALGLAIDEGRADKVGRYCAIRELGICWEEKESWCVFPTKLAGIIQYQGRFKQLHINFGSAHGDKNKPNCRGLTPEELARINFESLDLSAVLSDFKSHMKIPNPTKQDALNKIHIEAMHQKGQAHD